MRDSARVSFAAWCGLTAGIAVCCGLVLVAPAQQSPHSTATSDDSGFVIRSQSNLIVVPVIVRDAAGKSVDGLTRDNFEVLDNKKPQVISHFSAETAAEPTSLNTKIPDKAVAKMRTQAAAPERFVGLFFDNYHLEFGDLSQIREAARRYLATNLDSGARIAIFSATGGEAVEFTNDRDKLERALAKLTFQPVVERCPGISVYLAQMVEDGDQGALQAAEGMVRPCRCRVEPCPPMDFAAREESRLVLIDNQGRTEGTLMALENTVRRIAGLPGERTIAMLSDGFVDEREEYRLDALVDHALRANIIINALDARGLYATLPEEAYARQGVKRQADTLAEAAEGTGGVFIENTNDLAAGLAKIESPHTTYILGFSPGNLKSDGQFHKLQVKLVNSAHLTVQARRGYFAPRGAEDSDVAQKQAMENAIFSREDVRGLSIQISTKFVKVDERTTKIDVTVGADMQSVRFRKAGGRNLDDITLMVALFDQNGNYVTGQNQVIKLNLTDTELEKLKTTGGEGTAELNAKPGNYAVRAVMGESESKLLGASSRNVQIP